jgi:hypothetical protein
MKTATGIHICIGRILEGYKKIFDCGGERGVGWGWLLPEVFLDISNFHCAGVNRFLIPLKSHAARTDKSASNRMGTGPFPHASEQGSLGGEPELVVASAANSILAGSHRDQLHRFLVLFQFADGRVHRLERPRQDSGVCLD